MSVALRKLAPENAERRFLSREKIYDGDGISCAISIQSKLSYLKVQDLSPEGLCAIAKSGSLQLAEGCLYDLFIQGPDSQNIPVKAFLLNIYKSEKDQLRLGFKFVSNSEREHGEELRLNYRFGVHNLFPPTGMCDHPLFFGEKIFFRIEDLSAGGMRVSTSLRLKSLIPGQQLRMSLQIPTQKTEDMQCIIRYILIEADRIILGLEFAADPKRIHEAMAEYIFSMTNYSIRQIKEAGIFVGGISKGLSFTYPRSEEDWDQIKELRLRAYHNSGKFKHVESPKDMYDEFDQYARNIICKIKGKVIASGRVIFVNGDQNRSEHFRLGIKVPDWVWTKKVCEFSRACTDLDYRGSDLFVRLLQHFGRLAYQDGCEIVLANCNSDLWPLYKSLGFRKLGKKFSAFGRDDCQLIYTRVADMMKGKKTRTLSYNQIIYPIADFLNKQSGGSLLGKSHEKFHRILHPFIKKLKKSSKSRK